MSVIARWAATPRTCESANDVIACTTVAMPAAIASGINRSARCLPTTSSISDLEVQGRTRPERRLTIMSRRPTERRPRRAQTSARASCHALEKSIFFLSLGDSPARSATPERPALSRPPPRCPPPLSGIISSTTRQTRRSSHDLELHAQLPDDLALQDIPEHVLLHVLIRQVDDLDGRDQ